MTLEIIIIFVIVAWAVASVVYLHKRKKSGKCIGCGGDCSKCSGCSEMNKTK